MKCRRKKKIIMILTLLITIILSGCTTQNNNEKKVDQSAGNERQEEEVDQYNLVPAEEVNIKLPISLVDKSDTPYDDTVITPRNSTYNGMYVIKDSYLYSEPKIDSQLVSVVQVGCALNVVESNEEWSFVKILFISGSHLEKWHGWIPTSSLGYYEDLHSKVGIHVLIKEGYEPESAQEFYNGLWGIINLETDKKYGLSIYGAGSIEIDKKNIEPFFMKKESNN